MAAEPDFCRDILETRIKGILKEHLKISRDISFLQVWTWQGFLPWVWLFRWRGLTLLQRWMEPYPALSVLPPGKTRRTYCDKPSCWKVVVSTSLRTSLIRTVSSWSPSRHLGLLCLVRLHRHQARIMPSVFSPARLLCGQTAHLEYPGPGYCRLSASPLSPIILLQCSNIRTRDWTIAINLHFECWSILLKTWHCINWAKDGQSCKST